MMRSHAAHSQGHQFTMRSKMLMIVASVAILLPPASPFVPMFSSYCNPSYFSAAYSRRHSFSPFTLSLSARYGPTEEPADKKQEEWERRDAERVKRQEVEFRQLVEKVMEATNPDHLPGLMTRHMDMLLEMRGYEGTDLIKEIIEEAQEEEDKVMTAIDYILSFVEEFVEQAQSLDSNNKLLLGKIIKQMVDKTPDVNREELLDELMEREKPNFTAGFLKHVEGECERIASAPKMTPESSRLLETLRVIQTRVLEELGKDLGEGALVLGQLLGYTDSKERLAVLDAGLTVRGVGFAKEMADLTQEALEGFTKVAGGADPELIKIVAEIDDRIKTFLDKNNVLQ